jgi:hypothetical protein
MSKVIEFLRRIPPGYQLEITHSADDATYPLQWVGKLRGPSWMYSTGPKACVENVLEDLAGEMLAVKLIEWP